jgi:mannan endo-1,4-beta-mannosidase
MDPQGPEMKTKTADPKASPDAVGVLRYLSALPRGDANRVLSGQNVSSANAELAKRHVVYWEGLEAATGKLPALLSIDYGWEEADPDAIAEANELIVRHWERGGLVTVGMHFANPWTGGSLRRRGLGDCRYLDVVTPGTEANRRWMNMLSNVADGLEELQEAGVVVLWRPLHEMNGDWFWWSAGDDDAWARPEEFRALWAQMLGYLCNERGLHNLLWVYAPNAETSDGLKSTMYYYPGDDMVDVVGLDHYGNSLDSLNARGGYDALVGLGKPVAITEVGPAFWWRAHPKGTWDNTTVIRAIRDRYPAVCYFVYWHGWGRTRMAIVENEHAAELLDDPWVVTVDEVAWRRTFDGPD